MQGFGSVATEGSGGNAAMESNCRFWIAAGNLLAGMGGGGRQFAGEVGGFSHESELDLAAMVSDFLENGSSGAESWCSSDSDSGFIDLAHLAEKVLLYRHTDDQIERNLLSTVHSLILCINETDTHFVKAGPCNASCIRQSLVKLLRFSGYDAAVCISKWHGFDKVPGGDHEYIDVIVNGSAINSERLIIDIDFRSHFEIARAVKSYDAILNSLPAVYVGSLPKLKQFLQIMVEAARSSLKQNSMPLPPWRSLAYLQAKWQSAYERKHSADGEISNHIGSSDHKQCISHLRRLKSTLQSEVGTECLLPIIDDNNGRVKVTRWRHPVFISG